MKYTLLRLLLLVSFAGMSYALGMRGLLLLLVAFLGSGVVSFFVLRSVRTSAGEQVGGFFRGLNARIDAAAAAEDSEDDSDEDTSDGHTSERRAARVTLPNTSADPRTAD